ncbi:hypothetical protein F4860DRAFT_479565 [Xylaria cubensis]|nr:hypothetical protein F4860DRAFT_479565 [Xylaria cubensis]
MRFALWKGLWFAVESGLTPTALIVAYFYCYPFANVFPLRQAVLRTLPPKDRGTRRSERLFDSLLPTDLYYHCSTVINIKLVLNYCKTAQLQSPCYRALSTDQLKTCDRSTGSFPI